MRQVLPAALLALAATFAPSPARAQLGIIPGAPQIVFDPTAVGKLITQLNRQLQQINMQRRQLQAQLDNMKKLGNPNWRTVGATMSEIDELARQGEAISYSLAALDAEFRKTFPGAELSTTMAADLRAQDARTLATIRGALNAVRATAGQFATGTATLQAMKGRLGSITSAQQAAELTGVIGIHTAEEITLLRQQLAAQGNAEAIVMAHQINRDAQAAAAAAAFDSAGARTPPTRPRPAVQLLGFAP